jgi:hypothetical protein
MVLTFSLGGIVSRHVPKYLLPRGMQVADLNRKRKRRKIRKSANLQRHLEKDPLHSFHDGDIDLNGLEGDDANDIGAEDMPDFEPEKDAKRQKRDDPKEKKIFANTRDGTGNSTSGRNAWKEKHRKGKFSGKKRKSERKHKDPLGI